MIHHRFLITGGNGNLARQVVSQLMREGDELVTFDITHPPQGALARTVHVQGDITSPETVRDLFATYRPTHVLHFASLLSSRSEEDRALAWRINMDAGFEIFERAIEFGVKGVFFPSTGATYAAGVPDPLPEDTPQWPGNLYGVTKVAMERLGVYYHQKHGLDFRCLRLPLVISRFAPPGAVSAYASRAFMEAAAGRPFVFPVLPSTAISTIYVKDVVEGIAKLILTPNELLTRRVYNVHGFSPSAEAIATAITEIIPDFRWKFEPVASVVALMGGWPKVHDDTSARRDWGWQPQFDLATTAQDLIREIRANPSLPFAV